MIGLFLIPLALASGNRIVWGIICLCLASPFIGLALQPFIRHRRQGFARTSGRRHLHGRIGLS